MNLDLHENFLIFGTGAVAQKFHDLVNCTGKENLGFFDFKLSGQLKDREIFNPSTIPNELLHLPILLGVNNPYVDLKLRSSQLEKIGFSKIVSSVQFVNYISIAGLDFNSYWLTTKSHFLDALSKKKHSLSKKLADQNSIDILENIIDYRIQGDISSLKDPINLSEQYFPSDINFISDEVYYLDIGAYDGDTFKSMLDHKVVPKSYVALEPDLINFRKLIENLRVSNIPSFALPLGTSEKTQMLNFDSSGDSSSGVSNVGTDIIQCVSVDDFLFNQKISHVKMDIEGSELSTLVGMKRTLETQRPNLAVSIYHNPSDLWEILEYLYDLDLGYEFYIRTYGFNTFETVLYAV